LPLIINPAILPPVAAIEPDINAAVAVNEPSEPTENLGAATVGTAIVEPTIEPLTFNADPSN